MTNKPKNVRNGIIGDNSLFEINEIIGDISLSAKTFDVKDSN